jgi:hypothetical protein
MKILRYVSNVFLTLVLAVLLARYVANLPYEWPWLTGSIRWVLRVFNARTYDNPDDMFDLASIVIFFASLAVVGLVVWAVNVGARRYRRVAHH